jgi:hypothetical protein
VATLGKWRNLAEPTKKTQRAALWLKLRCEGLGPLELPLMAKACQGADPSLKRVLCYVLRAAAPAEPANAYTHVCPHVRQHPTCQHLMLQIYEFTTLHSDLQDRAALQGQVWTHTYYIVALVLKQLHPTCQMLHASISRIWRLRLASAAPLDQVQ